MRVKLIRLEDPYTKLKSGDMGSITGVDDLGNLIVKWDSNIESKLTPDVDEYKIIEDVNNIKKIALFELKSTDINLDYINAKVQELQELVKSFIGSRIYHYHHDNLLKIVFVYNRERLKISWYISTIDMTIIEISNHNNEETQWCDDIFDIEEGFYIIEKEIYYWLDISEKNKSHERYIH